MSKPATLVETIVFTIFIVILEVMLGGVILYAHDHLRVSHYFDAGYACGGEIGYHGCGKLVFYWSE